jgi:hypothetical protein
MRFSQSSRASSEYARARASRERAELELDAARNKWWDRQPSDAKNLRE